MSSTDRTSVRASSGASRNPWSVEPELPPDGAESRAVKESVARERLTELLNDTTRLTSELTAEMAALRPILVQEPSTETAYVAAMHRLEAARQTTAEVKEALQRLDDGSYGWCVNCLEPIPAGRLELRPQARHCVNCS